MSPEQPAEPLNFEDALVTLEQIVRDLEEGKLGLAESVDRYEQGVKLLGQCHALLERAERRIDLLSGVGPSGEPITQPLDDAALSLEEKADARTQRRSRPGTRSKPRSDSPKTAEVDPNDPGSLF